ncbi:MAG: AAA family ATPase [Burkholderiales bacterium]
MLNGTVEAEFAAAMREAGIEPPAEVIADGNVHRFDLANEKRGRRSGAYRLYPDGRPAGWFQSHKDARGLFKWKSNAKPVKMDAETMRRFRQEVAKRKAAQAEQDAKRRATAARCAADTWDGAQPAVEHPYLLAKGIKAHGIREADGKLLVPLRDTSGRLHSLQSIGPDGEKRFLPDGQTAGCYHAIGTPDRTVIVCEGYATAATVHETTGHAVAVAFNAGNLLAVANVIRARRPNVIIVLAADDDWRTEGNPGMTKATEAALAVGGVVAVPKFDKDRPDGATDYNDMFRHRGAQAVREAVERAIASTDTDPSTDNAEAARDAEKPSQADRAFVDGAQLLDNFEPPEYLLEPVIVRGQVVGFTGHPNNGKTAVALPVTLGCVGIVDIPGTIAEPATGKALLLFGENDTNATGQLYATLLAYGRTPEAIRDRVWVWPYKDRLDAMVARVEELADRIGGLDVIMVDSKAAYSPADDENDNVQAATDAATCRAFTRVSGKPAVIIICHPPKGARGMALEPRGGGAFIAEADANFGIELNAGVIEWHHTKLRQPAFESPRFRMQPVTLPKLDKRGRPVRSAAAVIALPEETEAAQKAQRSDEDALLMQMHINPKGTQREWQEACGWKHPSRVTRTLLKLKDHKLAKKVRDEWRLTELGKKEIA